jgi:hypothetical protein
VPRWQRGTVPTSSRPMAYVLRKMIDTSFDRKQKCTFTIFRAFMTLWVMACVFYFTHFFCRHDRDDGKTDADQIGG